jgi:class 3 adenylate cyclase
MTAPEITLARHVPELALDWMHSHPGEHWRLIEGTLCFADISGFTRLAERLAQRGRRGGEELVETLSRVFGTMLDVAHDNGGGLLKFGGDALLLFFSGDGHALRAANTAIQMRAALREAAKIPTSVGKLNLSMSVGLHSGDVHFLLVGSTHRELVILGPAASKIIETEGAANAGQILTSPTTAAALPTSATRPAGEHLELRWRTPKPAPASQPVSDATSTDARSLFPEVLGEHLAAAVPDPEHRIACIAFMRASGTDALLAESGPDALAEAVHTTIGRAQEIFAEEGVTLLCWPWTWTRTASSSSSAPACPTRSRTTRA